MPAPIIYISKRRTAGKLNSPQNTSLGHYPTTEVENKSMPLYLYDIFETKLTMPNPEMYLKDKMYRDAVNNGNIEKAKTILLQEAKLKGYEITIENRNAITQIRYDEKGYLIPLSKSFDNDTANLDLPVFSCITFRFRKGFWYKIYSVEVMDIEQKK